MNAERGDGCHPGGNFCAQTNYDANKYRLPQTHEARYHSVEEQNHKTCIELIMVLISAIQQQQPSSWDCADTLSLVQSDPGIVRSTKAETDRSIRQHFSQSSDNPSASPRVTAQMRRRFKTQSQPRYTSAFSAFGNDDSCSPLGDALFYYRTTVRFISELRDLRLMI